MKLLLLFFSETVLFLYSCCNLLWSPYIVFVFSKTLALTSKYPYRPLYPHQPDGFYQLALAYTTNIQF